jgi:hypothetical protein
VPEASSFGSMKWFMPPTPATGSRRQAATHEPSTVTSAMSRSVAKYSPGRIFTASQPNALSW